MTLICLTLLRRAIIIIIIIFLKKKNKEIYDSSHLVRSTGQSDVFPSMSILEFSPLHFYQRRQKERKKLNKLSVQFQIGL